MNSPSFLTPDYYFSLIYRGPTLLELNLRIYNNNLITREKRYKDQKVDYFNYAYLGWKDEARQKTFDAVFFCF